MTLLSTSIPPVFTSHKAQILNSLSLPDDSYTDLSPKGSIDAPIRDLIDIINTLHGIVTTSSCSGRVSIFIEGRKAGPSDQDTEQSEADSRQRIVPGGKGFDGRWLYVSHDPLSVDSDTGKVLVPEELHPLLSAQLEGNGQPGTDEASTRLIHLSFEPLILHICTASLNHAKPVLALALDAGFRESGVQSLKCLDHAHAWPMVAIRSAGIAFSTVIGKVDIQGQEKLIVSRDYLTLMLEICNSRFTENQRRTERIRAGVQRLIAKQQEPLLREGIASDVSTWEDKDVRATRKREEGLQARDALRRKQGKESRQQDMQEDDILLGFGDELAS